MDIEDIQRYFLRSFASVVYPYNIDLDEIKKEIEEELNDKSN